MNWEGKRILVTGGASFIGSHLVDALVGRGSRVRVVDDLSSGSIKNIKRHLGQGWFEFVKGDLRRQEVARHCLEGIQVVFHLAAARGGRDGGDPGQSGPATNLALDGTLFTSCRDARVEKIVYASSSCVYPSYLRSDPGEILYLSEDKVGPPYQPKNMSGWAKLMAEMSLKVFHQEWGMRSASCRYFSVYGERGREDHPVNAMIARAFIGQDPFEVWGSGEQAHCWTYVGDVVSGTIRAAEVIEDGTAVNLGTMELTRAVDAAGEVMRYTGHEAEIVCRPGVPAGSLNPAADNSLAGEVMGWKPKTKFLDGLHRTIDWYFESKDRA